MPERKRTVLFICTGNSCRSQMAEAILRHVAGDKFEALSGGTHPAGVVQPIAIRALEKMGVPTDGLESKHLDQFADYPVNIAITVCDNASAECPSWLAADIKVHWGLPDPTFHAGDEDEREAFCTEIAERILKRVTRLVTIRFDQFSKAKLSEILNSLADL
ncbi:MAG: arsenate reductase ArsC [Planctomycetes bacterium]|nr:arsenate reductase ArsC [Planctomycetota bacterium]